MQNLIIKQLKNSMFVFYLFYIFQIRDKIKKSKMKKNSMHLVVVLNILKSINH